MILLVYNVLNRSYLTKEKIVDLKSLKKAELVALADNRGKQLREAIAGLDRLEAQHRLDETELAALRQANDMFKTDREQLQYDLRDYDRQLADKTREARLLRESLKISQERVGDLRAAVEVLAKLA
jgi:predicted  nucleic acid-binding Zn-ribbon protein